MNTYTNQAKEVIRNLMLAQAAMTVARTQYDSDICEVRFTEELQGANKMLVRWRTEEIEISAKIEAAEKDYQEIMWSVPATVSTNCKQNIFAGLARGIISKDEFIKRLSLRDATLKYKESLIESLICLREAIQCLEGYLYPSETQSHTDEDLPFESVPVTGFSTPQEAAGMLVNDVLNNHGREIAQEYYERQTLELKTDDAAIYDMLFQAGEEQFEANPVGEEFLEMYIGCPEWQSIRTLFEVEMFEQNS